MLKYFRYGYLRWFFSQRRVPYLIEYELHRNPRANVQQIHFIRERFYYTRKVGHALSWGCIFAATWSLQNHFLFGKDDKKNQEQKKQKQEDEDSSPKGNTVETVLPQKIGQEATELSSTNFPLFNGNSIFIPFGFSYEVPVAAFKGDSPEWQEFLRLNRDRERMELVEFELADQILEKISAAKEFKKVLGEPVSLLRYWVDILFPSRPPPEFERLGLEISWSGVRWTTRPVTAYNHFRSEQAVWPAALGQSFYAAYSAAWKDLTKWLGSDMQTNGDKPGQSSSSNAEDDGSSVPNTQVDSKAVPTDDQSSPTSSTTPAETTEDKPKKSSSSSKPQKTDATNQSKSGFQKDPNNPRKVRVTLNPPLAESNDHPSEMTVAFLRNLLENWTSPPDTLSRGVVYVRGRVEIAGPQANMVLDVRGAYNPKDSYWESIQIESMSHFRNRYQAPKG
ncbi:MAG: hypothetical protein M1816_001376 [Peltula sp. TS41687]|nr:MAG: hypothetical protein M1816_001376 [Peltula sp. TS41687]